jgi:cardiolipin synthase
LNAGRYYYSELLKSGVKLYERRDVLLHAKTAVIDGVWSTVGSTNMDFWSFSSNDEVNAVILNKEFAADMEKMFAGDVAESHEIRLDECFTGSRSGLRINSNVGCKRAIPRTVL